MKALIIPILFISIPFMESCKTTSTSNSSLNKEGKVEIKFMSDSIKIYSILESYQKVIYDNSKNSYRWTGSKEQIEILINLYKKYGLYNKKGKKNIKDNVLNVTLPTRYEDPIAFGILKSVREDVELAITKSTGQNYTIGIGTLPYWTLNAKTYNNQEIKEKLIVVNSGLFNFCNELIKILLETIRIEKNGNKIIFDYSEEYFLDKLTSNPNLIVRFSKALEDYSLNRTIRGEMPPQELQRLFLSEIENSMEFFALGHEYGHLFFNHNPIGQNSLELRNSENKPLNSMEFGSNNWKQEIEADLFAVKLLNYYIERKKSQNPDKIDFYPLLRNSPALFFKLSEIANSSKYIYQEKIRIPEQGEVTRAKQLSIAEKLISEILISKKDFFGDKIFNTEKLGNSVNSDTINIQTSHPTDNSRYEYLNKISRKKNFQSEDELQFHDLSLQMEKNLIAMWDYLKPILYKIIESNSKK